jgi:hypothetical protein
MERKAVLVDVDINLWALVKAQAESEGRLIRAVVESALRRYLEEPSRSQDPLPREGHGSERVSMETLRDRVNRVKPGATMTGREYAEREARRGDEGGSQIRDDDEDVGF